MQNAFAEELLLSIKTDNVGRFSNLVKDRRELLSLCYGRFPILSLCYLYGSYGIADKYGAELKQITGYIYEEEDFASYCKFRQVAGKALRLYTSQAKNIVKPLEMLAIVDDTATLKAEYAAKPQSDDTFDRLRKVFGIKYSEDVSKYRGKFNCHKSKLMLPIVVIFAVILLVACMTIATAGSVKTLIMNEFGDGTAENPYIVSNVNQLSLALANNLQYVVLDSDLDVPSEVYVETYSGRLDGAGHTIVLDAGREKALISVLSGNLANIVLEIDESSIDAVKTMGLLVGSDQNEEGGISNASLLFRGEKYYNVVDDSSVPFVITTDSQFAVAIERNCGYIKLAADVNLSADVCVDKFDGVLDGDGHSIFMSDGRKKTFVGQQNGTVKNLNIVTGKITAEANGTTALLFGENHGEILNLGIKFDGLVTDIESYEDGSENYVYTYYALVAGKNDGKIENVQASGSLTVVGNGSGDFYFSICAGINAGSITGVTIATGSTLTTETVDVGCVLTENSIGGSVSACSNGMNVNIKSTQASWHVLCGGILVNNYGTVKDCINKGNLAGKLEYSESLSMPHMGGIAVYNYYELEKCLNKGDVSFDVGEGYCVNLYLGGIVGEQTIYEELNSYPYIKDCGNFGGIYAKAGKTGNAKVTLTDGSTTTRTYDSYLFVGGIVGCSYGIATNNFSLGETKAKIVDSDDKEVENSTQAYAGGIMGLGKYDNNMVYSDWFYTYYDDWVEFYADNYFVSGNSATMCAAAMCSYSSMTISKGVEYGATAVESVDALKAIEVFWDEE